MYEVENIAKVRINGKSCMALLDNGVQINAITLSFAEECSHDVRAPVRPSRQMICLYRLGECIDLTFRLCCYMGSSRLSPGLDKDQIALVIPDL